MAVQITTKSRYLLNITADFQSRDDILKKKFNLKEFNLADMAGLIFEIKLLALNFGIGIKRLLSLAAPCMIQKHVFN